MPNDDSSGMPKTNNPDIATATVSAENSTVVPAVATVRSAAAWTSRPWPRSSRKRLTINSP